MTNLQIDRVGVTITRQWMEDECYRSDFKAVIRRASGGCYVRPLIPGSVYRARANPPLAVAGPRGRRRFESRAGPIYNTILFVVDILTEGAPYAGSPTSKEKPDLQIGQGAEGKPPWVPQVSRSRGPSSPRASNLWNPGQGRVQRAKCTVRAANHQRDEYHVVSRVCLRHHRCVAHFVPHKTSGKTRTHCGGKIVSYVAARSWQNAVTFVARCAQKLFMCPPQM